MKQEVPEYEEILDAGDCGESSNSVHVSRSRESVSSSPVCASYTFISPAGSRSFTYTSYICSFAIAILALFFVPLLGKS